jgi:hypothetical protein
MEVLTVIRASRPMASEDFLDEGLFMSVDGLGMNGNGRKGSKEGGRGLASCTQVAEPAGKGLRSMSVV